MSKSDTAVAEGTEIRTYFVRERNALVVRGDFSQVYVDFYLHLADFGMMVQPAEAGLLKDALAAVTLHCGSRPRTERVAWTVNFQDPLLNIFVTGDNPAGSVVGTVFSEGVKKGERNLFCADTLSKALESRRSMVDFHGADFFSAAERYYANSEQRAARYFRHHDDDFVLVSAQPDCDVAWLEGLDEEAIRDLDAREELSLLEQRFYRFHCGCSQSRMLEMLAPTFREDPEVLFGGEEVIRIQCPRCSAKYAVTREALEACVAAESREP